MFNLVSGLGTAYLYNSQPDLDAVAKRFSDPTTPATQRWGVADPVKVRTDRYSHQDEALAGTTTTASPAFLDQNYTRAMTPTLAMGYQEDTGTLDLGSPKGVSVSGGTLSFNLGDNALLTVRQVQIQMYHWGTGADGKLTVSTSFNLNVNHSGTRTCADGIAYNVIELASNYARLSSVPASLCLVAGDEVLLINLQVIRQFLPLGGQ